MVSLALLENSISVPKILGVICASKSPLTRRFFFYLLRRVRCVHLPPIMGISKIHLHQM
jgi:hypothetical protein